MLHFQDIAVHRVKVQVRFVVDHRFRVKCSHSPNDGMLLYLSGFFLSC